MMKKIFLSIGLLTLINASAWAANAKVIWQAPDKYTDIRATHEQQDRFQQRLFTHMEKVFADLGQKLPADSQLEITVTDFDLAGDIPPMLAGRMNEVRVIKDIYSPKISFTYTFTQNEQIISGTENFRDLNFMSGISRINKEDDFQYEEKMLRKSFDKLQARLVK
ncbi:DUF3016 domain-containing protein [Iodobacter sp.]|uniref:DUF3016 domain-containing protein n=1 Tax=Iodobacter sp. TaxID=1915058 RepID=UPI0025ECF075|nr:DUF3016 domain-containing protein [Iodobacter sp.]